MTTHPVITADYPENLHHGIMICGINFGYSKDDEALESSQDPIDLDPVSFFSDSATNNTRFRNRILRWLHSWDIPLSTTKGDETALDRAFFQTNWLDTQTKSVSSDGEISVKSLVDNADSFLGLIETRRPKAILFIGGMMIEALNDITLRKRVESLLGERPGNAQIHYSDAPNEAGKRFKVLTQVFPATRIISLPHTASIGLTDAYMAGFKGLIHDMILS